MLLSGVGDSKAICGLVNLSNVKSRRMLSVKFLDVSSDMVVWEYSRRVKANMTNLNKVIKSVAKDAVKKLRNHDVGVDKLIIHTQLSKNIEQYESKGPHVAAAQRMKDLGLDVFPGMIIRFVVVKGKGLIRDKVKLPDEVSQDDYDPEYYVQNQIIPGVDRIFAVFGIDIKDVVSKEGEQSTLASFG